MAALQRAGCERVVEEHVGATFGRLEELGALIGALGPGDSVLVARAEVLTSSYRRLLRILSAIEAKGAQFATIESSCDALPAGHVTLEGLRRAAATEHSAVSRSIRAGRERARHRGVQMGRPPKMTPLQQQEAIESWCAGEKVGDIAARYGVSRTVITRLTSELRRVGIAEPEWQTGLAVAAE